MRHSSIPSSLQILGPHPSPVTPKYKIWNFQFGKFATGKRRRCLTSTSVALYFRRYVSSLSLIHGHRPLSRELGVERDLVQTMRFGPLMTRKRHRANRSIPVLHDFVASGNTIPRQPEGIKRGQLNSRDSDHARHGLVHDPAPYSPLEPFFTRAWRPPTRSSWSARWSDWMGTGSRMLRTLGEAERREHLTGQLRRAM